MSRFSKTLLSYLLGVLLSSAILLQLAFYFKGRRCCETLETIQAKNILRNVIFVGADELSDIEDTPRPKLHLYPPEVSTECRERHILFIIGGFTSVANALTTFKSVLFQMKVRIKR